MRTERTVLDRLNGVPVRCEFAAGKLKGERGSGGGWRFVWEEAEAAVLSDAAVSSRSAFRRKAVYVRIIHPK